MTIGEPEEPRPSASDAVILATRLVQSLEWLRATRWRALLTWIVLTAIAGEITLRFLSDGVDFAVALVANQWPASLSPSPMPEVDQFWAEAATGLLFCWFQPFLLRLTSARGWVWVGIRTLAPAIAFLVVPLDVSQSWLWSLRAFMLGVLPGLALVNYRTPAFMIMPAAAICVITVWLLSHVLIPNYHAVIGCGLYGATLLYGTGLMRPEPA